MPGEDMDTFLPQLLAFPPHPPPKSPLSDTNYHKQIRALVDTLHSKPASLLVGGVKGDDDLLDILDPSINTLPYLYTLLAHIRNTNGKNKKDALLDRFAPGTSLWTRMILFMQAFDPIQIRYAGNELRRLMDYVIMSASNAKELSRAITPLESAILRVDPSGSTLTSTHIHFVALCLETRDYASALSVLSHDIFFLPASSDKQADAAASPASRFPCSKHVSSSTYITPASGLSAKLQYQDYLEYFLYGAMIYMGLKQWRRAQSFLEITVNCPTTSNVSKVQVEAYKKLLLVGLLRTGRPTSAPKTTSSQTSRLYDNLAKPYNALAKVFKEGIENEDSAQRLIAEVHAGHAIWQEDCNGGLVSQVVDAYRQFSVQHLEDTYAALTVGEVAHQTSPNPSNFSETGNYLTSLIDANLLHATISKESQDPKDWIVRFLKSTGANSLDRSEQHQLTDLTQQTEKIKLLMQQVREADRQLETSKEFVQEVKRSKKAKADGFGADDTNPFSLTGGFDHDEDMMEDL